MFENITRSDYFQQHNLHGDWSLEGFHRCLHMLLISKQFSQLTSLFQCFLSRGLQLLLLSGLSGEQNSRFLSNPKSREIFSQIFIPHILYFPNQGEYVTETPLGPGGEASYSTVSILPTSLPVCKKNYTSGIPRKQIHVVHIDPHTQVVLSGPKCEVEEISGPTGQSWSEISYMDLFLRSS